jgi:2-polyprenyl-3-methyl-5-hydroxy-6-metoxy-1,4-benzoquinol methylase
MTSKTSDGPAAGRGYYGHERPDVLELVPASARDVLDCGCGEGWLGEQLRRRGCRVTGIELHPAAAEVAARRLDRVLAGNLEACVPALSAGSFDCVVCADVLEHLVDPWQVVGELKRVLRPRGALVCSVPNIRYVSVVVDLLVRGRWTYREEGVLDRTHLRFFTRRTFAEFLTGAGFEIDVTQPNVRQFPAWFQPFSFLLRLVCPELRVVQWRVRAFKP